MYVLFSFLFSPERKRQLRRPNWKCFFFGNEFSYLPLIACILHSTIGNISCHTQHTSLYLCKCIPTERKENLFQWEDMRLNQRKGEQRRKISLLIWYSRLLYGYLMRMGRRHFEWMHSGSLRVLLMCIKTLANYAVFTPSWVLVLIMARWFSSC